MVKLTRFDVVQTKIGKICFEKQIYWYTGYENQKVMKVMIERNEALVQKQDAKFVIRYGCGYGGITLVGKISSWQKKELGEPFKCLWG